MRAAKDSSACFLVKPCELDSGVYCIVDPLAWLVGGKPYEWSVKRALFLVALNSRCASLPRLTKSERRELGALLDSRLAQELIRVRLMTLIDVETAAHCYMSHGCTEAFASPR